MIIRNTAVQAQHAWPADASVQGGDRGVVFRRDGTSYATAFVEVYPAVPAVFLRGEGATLADAEDSVWAKFQTMLACPTSPAHGPFEARAYYNGCGHCVHCGIIVTGVLPAREPDENFEPHPMADVLDRIFVQKDIDAARNLFGQMRQTLIEKPPSARS